MSRHPYITHHKLEQYLGTLPHLQLKDPFLMRSQLPANKRCFPEQLIKKREIHVSIKTVTL